MGLVIVIGSNLRCSVGSEALVVATSRAVTQLCHFERAKCYYILLWTTFTTMDLSIIKLTHTACSATYKLFNDSVISHFGRLKR